jgi:hypothetical protein
MRVVTAVIAAVIMLAASSASAVVVINDGSFAGWILGSYGVGGGTATAVVESAGGNPGARLNITTVTSGVSQTAFGTAIKPDFSTSATLAGTAFIAQFDVLSGAGAFGQGQAVQLLVEQGGAVYAAPIGVTGLVGAFSPVSLSGTLNAASFTLVSGSGPATPNLTGGTATRFGIAAGNTNSATLTQYYDNFVLDLAAAATAVPGAPIPALSWWALALLAMTLASVAVFQARRRG